MAEAGETPTPMPSTASTASNRAVPVSTAYPQVSYTYGNPPQLYQPSQPPSQQGTSGYPSNGFTTANTTPQGLVKVEPTHSTSEDHAAKKVRVSSTPNSAVNPPPSSGSVSVAATGPAGNKDDRIPSAAAAGEPTSVGSKARSLDNIVLPNWPPYEIDRRLKESQGFIQEWTELLDKSGV
jgi:hypothetical protein